MLLLSRKPIATRPDNDPAEIESRRIAMLAASHVVGWPTAIVVASIVVNILIPVREVTEIWSVVVVAAMAIYAGMMLVVYIGGFCSWLSHLLVWPSNIPAKYMAIAIALIFDFAVVGWTLVLTWTHSNDGF